MVRCKFQLVEVHSYTGGRQKFIFQARYDTSIPEDQRFCKATPDGRFEMVVDNPRAQELFQVGESYYFDAIPLPTA